MTSNIKNIVLTGASSGIGYETALTLAKQGHKVFAIARSADKLEALRKASSSFNGQIVPVPFDLVEFDEDILLRAFKDCAHIDVLINNAGRLLNKNFLEIKESEIHEVFQVNYVAVVKLIQFLYSKLKKSNSAHIVNISSVGGVTGSVKFPGLSMYSSSKGALSILSECLAQDFAEDKIAVNCLALGSVNTDMLKQAFPEYNSQTNPDQIAEFLSNFALNAHSVINGVTQTISISNP